MTFSSIIFKMFKKEAKKYRLFILCNMSSIAVLYSFISISENKQFMDPSIVDPMISSNIFAPTLLVVVFTGMFIPYSQSVFIKARQKDYGILITLGLEEDKARNSVLLENGILGILSLVIGLAVGTFFCLLFLVVIRGIIGIDDVNINISIRAYKITTIYVTAIFIISLIVNIYSMIKRSIYEKIKYTVKIESKGHYSSIS